MVAGGWFFVLIVYSFGGANPPQQIGPFKTFAECEEIRKSVMGPNGKTTACWEAPR